MDSNVASKTINSTSENLYLASADGDLAAVSALLEDGADPNYIPASSDYGLWNSLHVACANDRPKVVAALLADKKTNVLALDRKKYTPFHYACLYGYTDCIEAFKSSMDAFHGFSFEVTLIQVALEKEQLDVIMKYLISEFQTDPKEKDCDDILNLCCSKGEIGFVKQLMDEYHCVPSKSKDHVFGLCCEEGELNLAKEMVTKYNCVPRPDDLVSACENNHYEIVCYLLTDLTCDPNAPNIYGQTPLTKAKNKEVIQLLLQHGAHVSDVYDQYSRSMGLISNKNPLENPVKMFIIGHGGEGKSTLIAAMQIEKLRKAGEVTGVSQQTAGIVPKVFESDIYGYVQFFDFAGQEAYHSSHAAVIKSSVVACPPVFILVVGLHRKDDKETLYSVEYWLSIVANQCIRMEGKAPLIVIASHLDEVPAETKDRKQRIIERAVNRYLQFDFIGFVAMDCRYPNTTEMKSLRKIVGIACSHIRSKLSVSLNSHMFLVYLLDKLGNEIWITLEHFHLSIKAALDQEPQRKGKNNILPFIPTEFPRLVEICLQLSDKGHILFIENKQSPGKSFIIIDPTKITADVNGSIFAPPNFKEHCKLASSTGIVPKSRLVRHFSGYSIDMIVGFLSHHELAVPIEDKEVIQLIKRQTVENGQETEVYLFCPGLIRLEAPPESLQTQQYTHHFGWIIYCRRSDKFFDIRLFQVLLLRLALSQKLALRIDDSVPSIQHFCAVWKTGIQWCTSNDISVLVHLGDNSKSINVQMHTQCVTLEFNHLRSKLINNISKAVKELCPMVSTIESLVNPLEVEYPMKSYSELKLIDFQSIAESIVRCEPCVVVNGTSTLRLNRLLQVEVYADLGECLLQALFNEADSASLEQGVCDEFLYALSSKWARQPEVLNQIKAAFIQDTQIIVTSDALYFALKKWRAKHNGTYESIRSILDEISVFSGKNLLELAKVPFKPFDKNQLHHEETQSLGPQAPNPLPFSRSASNSTYSDISTPSGYGRDPSKMSPEEFEQFLEKAILLPFITQPLISPLPNQDSIAVSSIGSGREAFTSLPPSTISEDDLADDDQVYPPSPIEENRRIQFPVGHSTVHRHQSLPNSFKMSEQSVYEQLSLKRPDGNPPLSFYELVCILWDARNNWRNLGMQLGINDPTLKVIETDHKLVNFCFLTMLVHWLLFTTNPTPSITALVVALKSHSVVEKQIANKLNLTISRKNEKSNSIDVTPMQ